MVILRQWWIVNVGFWVMLTCLTAPVEAGRVSPVDPPITIHETLQPSAIHDVSCGDVQIEGRLHDKGVATVLIRVTTSAGDSHVTSVDAEKGKFKCSYPSMFAGAKQLKPCMIFIDATLDKDFDVYSKGHFQAEAALFITDKSEKTRPEFPSAFTADLLDKLGKTDSKCTEWPVIRKLVNLYMHSQAAKYVGAGYRGFDLEKPKDLQYFKNEFALYDFDHRDRNWSTGLKNRRSRTFWQAVWNYWFNSSNNNPLDGNNQNNDPANFTPYTFVNDFCDILMCYLMRLDHRQPLDDNLDMICREGIENVLGMQHHGKENFARVDAHNRKHTYTAGAFRYGLFETGEFLTEGKGWFYNPNHTDYIDGGVFNGRAVWALGKALVQYPRGELSEKIKASIALCVKFCLIDSIKLGYAHKTAGEHVIWRDPGEHAYLMLGMMSACEVAPDLKIAKANGKIITLRDLCVDGMDGLVDEMAPYGQWMIYADKDSMIIAAMADGVRVLADHPNAVKWKKAVIQATDSWVNAKIAPGDYPAPLVHFGRRPDPDRLTFRWGADDRGNQGRNFIFLYKSGHWIHALAKMYALTGDSKYRIRAEKMVSYLCGANPFHVRLLNELGGVYNWQEDTDGDGVEDQIIQDMYPESTAFCQIGIIHLLNAIHSH